RAAAQTFRTNPAMDTERVISELRTGEALVSFLDRKGAPAMVERALILPPEGGIGPISAEERQAIIQKSPMQRLYGVELDRESAYELLAEHTEQRQREAEEAAAEKARLKEENAMRKARLEAERLARAEAREARLREKEARQREKQEQGLWGDILHAATKSTTRTITNTIGREIGKSLLRGVLGSLFGGKR
ncbi:MAG: DUF853 family protein, partial [Mailhella sp.]|nr:DUF853 family protein [Mailhella sp.]